MPVLPDLAAFFSFCISFFCLLDLGAAFCTFFCSLFATFWTSYFQIESQLWPLPEIYLYCTKFTLVGIVLAELLALMKLPFFRGGHSMCNHTNNITYIHRLTQLVNASPLQLRHRQRRAHHDRGNAIGPLFLLETII